MQIVQCEKGHFYDSALGHCPQCAEEAQNGGASMGFDAGVTAPTSIGSTAPVSDMGGYGATTPIGPTQPTDDIPMTPPAGFGYPGSSGDPGRTVPVTQPGFTTGDFGGKTSGGWQVEDYGPTEVSGIDGKTGFDPIVGWLVCTSGPNRGKDYRLHSGTNFIGSSKKMDVCIDGDRTISHENAASISYDDREKIFFVQKGDSRNLIYLNGKAVRSDADLAIYDRLTIGSTELVFVPLCCETFTWQDNA